MHGAAFAGAVEPASLVPSALQSCCQPIATAAAATAGVSGQGCVVRNIIYS
jgi:hypothetical protein